MYKLLLIFKYLRKRRIAWVSLAAVTLCTAMVIVVISVMGGWLRMFRQVNHALVGDLIVSRIGLEGFEHYDEMIDEITKIPEVKAAAPLMRTFGLININGHEPDGVQVIGLDIKRMADINGFVNSLHLQPSELEALANDQSEDLTDADRKAMLAKAATFPSFDKPFAAETYRQRLPRSREDPSERHGMIIGDGVIGLRPDKNGHIPHPMFIYDWFVRLTVMTSTSNSSLDPRSVDQYWVIDDSRTGDFAADETCVYVSFDDLQKQLDMTDPARCNDIEISLKDGYLPDVVKPKVMKVVDAIVNKYGMDRSATDDPIFVQTWEEKQARILAAVEHEEALLVILFAIISVVAIFLIFCIFYMIVAEKTRDIGIIKSVGATGPGVAAIFLGYGLVIGIVGSGAGLLLGYLIIHNINALHTWMSHALGITIWDAQTYVFDTIPNKMIPRDVVIIVTVAILSSVLGSVVPAIRAARLNPVEALRWE